MKRNSLPDLSVLEEQFNQCKESLDYYKSYLRDLAATKPNALPILYSGWTEDEFNEYFELLQSEILLLFIFDVISITEGKIRNDFFDRVDTTVIRNDNVSRKYKERYRKAGATKAKEIRLETLMEIWKNHFTGNNNRTQIIGEFKNRMKVRHWLAHGRYWDFNSYIGYTVKNTADRCNQLLQLIPHTY